MENKDKPTTWISTKEKAKQEGVSIKTILRHAQANLYPGAYQVSKGSEWRFPSNDCVPVKNETTPLEIITQEKRKRAILSHFDELRQIATSWKKQLYLPVPWRWDIADLRQVFYKVENEPITGYKPMEDLEENEKSMGHLRKIDNSIVHWTIQEDGTVFLNNTVETKPMFQSLKSHTPMSLAWGLYSEWKSRAGTYIKDCSSLLQRIKHDVERSLRSDSELVSWVIYHDALYFEETKTRCEVCGAKNPTVSKTCSVCHLPPGTLKPIATRFEQLDHPQEVTIPLRIPSWGNLDDFVSKDHIDGVILGVKALKEKYLGSTMVERILESESAARLIHGQLLNRLQELSQQEVFEGQCGLCPIDPKIK